MEMVNGYVFLDLTKANVYAKALKVLGTDKPVVIKDGSGSPYFVDSMALVGTNVVITKGGKTITISNDNTITNVGDIQNHLYNLCIQFEYQVSDEDTSNCYMNINFNKTSITIEELISSINGGETIFDDSNEVLLVVEPKQTEIIVRAFNTNGWGDEYEKTINTTTISNLAVKSYTKIY